MKGKDEVCGFKRAILVKAYQNKSSGMLFIAILGEFPSGLWHNAKNTGRKN